MSLPSGYRKLEYIQSSGTQYIDTGFKPNQDTRVVTKISFNALASSSSCYAFGAANSGSSGMFEISTGNNMIRLGYGGTAVMQTFPSTKPFTIDFNKNVVTINETAYTLTAATFTGTYSMYICDTNRGRAYRAIPAVTVYSFQIYDNGTLVRDFIPCKNASGVVGMWDDVNSVFYQNAGSGTFDAGELSKAHKVCINEIGYSATKVTMLIDGTERKAKKGRVLIDGTAYDVLFAEETVTITVHNGAEYRNCYVLYNGQRITSGEIDVKIGETIVVYVGAPNQNSGFIYLNSVVVVKGFNVQYEYPATKNATISYSWLNNLSSDCYIVEE